MRVDAPRVWLCHRRPQAAAAAYDFDMHVFHPIIASNGMGPPGYLPPAQLKQWLDQNAAQ